MQHYKSYKSDDDDDDDDIYGIEDDHESDKDPNNSINNKTNIIMNNWLKRNWFITLRTRNEMRHISFINIIEVNTVVEGQQHFLNFVTSTGTYKCGMSKEQCRHYSDIFREGSYVNHDLRVILCDSVELIQ